MKINRIEVANVLGIARAEINLNTPILLVAGDNMAGKSSLRDAISMALTGKPSRVDKKKDFPALIHGGAKKGRVTLHQGDEVLSEILLPAGTVSGAEPTGLEFLPALIDPSLFARMSADERRGFLFKASGTKADPKKIAELAKQAGLDDAKFNEVKAQLLSGFPAVAKYAQEQARELKGAWKHVTGEQWGADKAEGWETEIPQAPSADKIEAAQKEVAELQAEITRGAEYRGTVLEKIRAAKANADHIAELTAKAGMLERYEAKLKVTKDDHKKYKALHKEALENLTVANAWCMCPNCDAQLQFHDGRLIEHFGEKPTEGIAALKAELQKTVDALALLERTLANDTANVDAAKRAAEELATLTDSCDTEELGSILERTDAALLELQGKAEQAKAKAAALAQAAKDAESMQSVNVQAAEIHENIKAWLELAEAFSPSGIPAKILASAIAPFNESLSVLASRAGWPVTQITHEFDITSNGRVYALCSESEKWRADTLIALAVAQITGLKFVILDRFDVLSFKARSQLVQLMLELCDLQAIDTAIILGTLKEVPQGMPEEITTAWISNNMIEVA